MNDGWTLIERLAMLRSIPMIDLIPSSIKNDEKVRAIAAAFDASFFSVIDEVMAIIILPRIDEQPSQIVDELAWQLHVDFYNAELPLEKRRALVKGSIIWHMKKGTPFAVEGVISAAFDQSRVLEWFEYGGEPYFFQVETTDRMLEPKKLDDLIEAIFSVKNTRSWLDCIRFIVEHPKRITFAPAIRHYAKYTILPRKPETRTQARVGIAAAVRHYAKYTIEEAQ